MTKQKLQHKNNPNAYSNKIKSKRAILTALVLLFVFSHATKAQTPTCSELYSYVKQNGGYPSARSCFGSSFLAKVERYEVNGDGVVVAWIKSNEYDFNGKPYMYCGISSSTWSYFTSAGTMGSWGKAFHKYIKGNNCNCN